MPIPTSAPANAFIIKGLTTIRWGTDGFMKDGGLATAAIVRSIKQARMKDDDKEENNAGFTITRIILIQGQTYDITCTDDSAISWPDTGNKALLQGPDDASPIEFLVVDDGYNIERKKSGERVLKCECFTAFDIV